MNLLSFLFRCSHKHTSRVFTDTRRWPRRHYVVCLECGTEQEYDWDGLGKLKETKLASLSKLREAR